MPLCNGNGIYLQNPLSNVLIEPTSSLSNFKNVFSFCEAALKHTKFGTPSAKFILVKALIPPFLGPLIQFLPAPFNISLKRVIVVELKTST